MVFVGASPLNYLIHRTLHHAATSRKSLALRTTDNEHLVLMYCPAVHGSGAHISASMYTHSAQTGINVFVSATVIGRS